MWKSKKLRIIVKSAMTAETLIQIEAAKAKILACEFIK